MNITLPYKNVEQHTIIIIEPHQMNSDIRNHLKYNLKKKVEKKCNMNGYVDEIYKITKYSDGMMYPENLSGNANYNISYHCKLYFPIENSIIIGQVKVINQELIIAINGPLLMIIPREYIDTKYWINNIDNFTYKENPTIKLNIADYVCVQIINKKINKYDTQIKIIGKLLDFPTEKQVEKYFEINDNDPDNLVKKDSNFI